MVPMYFATLTLLFFLASGHAQDKNDLGFRIENGTCQKNGEPGYSNDYFGECGKTNRRFTNSVLETKNFQGLVVKNGDLTNLKSTGTDFSFADLELCRMNYAIFNQALFKNSNLRGCRMFRVSFEKVNFFGANLSGVKAPEANLRGANFTNAKLIGAYLMRADLRDANLQGADLSYSHLAMALLKGCRYDEKTKLPFSHTIAKKRGMILLP